MNGFGIFIGITVFLIAIYGFIFTASYSKSGLIIVIIILELILLSIGFLYINLSFHLDDLIGYLLTLYLLPIAGAESAIALAFLVAYYPLRGSLTLNDL